MLRNSSKFPGFLPFAAALFVALPAIASGGAAGYVEEYRQYNEALAAGDTEAAGAHALAAWKAAESALGDHKTTAVLAYNYGQLMLFATPEAALPALQRAQDLQDAGIAELPVADLNVYLTFARFRANDANAGSLRRALKAREESGEPASIEVGHIWLELAVFDINSYKYPLAAESAEKAEAAIEAAAPQDRRTRAQAIMIQGAAALLPLNRFLSSIEKAHAHFERAMWLFPPQKDIETFDPILAQLAAWDLTARALVGGSQTEYRANQILSEWREAPVLLKRDAEYGECKIEWEERKPPRFPHEAADKNYAGATFIGFHLDEDGGVRDARILAEVPKAVFGETALKAVRAWRAKASSEIEPECKTDLLTYITFQF